MSTISFRKTKITRNKTESWYIAWLSLNSIHIAICVYVDVNECVFIHIYNVVNKNQTILGRWGGDAYVIASTV